MRNAGATTGGQAAQPQQQNAYSTPTRQRQPTTASERDTSVAATSSSGATPEALPSQPQLQPPRVQLRLRSVGWPDADTRRDAATPGAIASVALGLSLVQGSDGRGYDGGKTGTRDRRHSDDYWLLSDFDDGAVRLWQVRCTCIGGRFSSVRYGRSGIKESNKPLPFHAMGTSTSRRTNKFLACSTAEA